MQHYTAENISHKILMLVTLMGISVRDVSDMKQCTKVTILDLETVKGKEFSTFQLQRTDDMQFCVSEKGESAYNI